MSKPIPVRLAVAYLQQGVIALLEHHGSGDHTDLRDVAVNVNFRMMRVDIARLTVDGAHIDEWLSGFSIDPRDLAAFGTPVGLPTLTGSGTVQ